MKAAQHLLLISLATATLGCARWFAPPNPLRSSESEWWQEQQCGPNEWLLEATDQDGNVIDRRCVPWRRIPSGAEDPSRCNAPVNDPSCFCLVDPGMPPCPTPPPVVVPAQPAP
jgi:hypothetical protein